MAEEHRDIPQIDLPEELTLPFGGLLKDTIYNRVLAFITADPYSDYRVRDLVDIVQGNRSKIGDALRDLERQGLLLNLSHDSRHPIYRPRLDSLRLQALIFLAYSVVDDRDGTSLMQSSIEDFMQDPQGINEADGDAAAMRVRSARKTISVRD